MLLIADIDWSVAKDIILGIVASIVTLGVPYIGLLTLQTRLKETNLEGRVRTLEAHVKECVEVMDTPWPSDDNFSGETFTQRVIRSRQRF